MQMAPIIEPKQPFSLKKKIMDGRAKSTENFYDYLNEMSADMKEEQAREEDAYYRLNSLALVGDPEAVSYFMGKIEKYLRKKPFTGKFPEAYTTVTEALFHEWKGFGPAYKWFTDRAYSESPGLQFIGKQIFYKLKGVFVPYPYSMPSLERLEQLKRSLLQSDPSQQLDRNHPSAEFKMDDPLFPGRFIRIAIWIEPRVWSGFTTISMRRQIVEFMSLEDQVGSESMPAESLPMIHSLVGLFLNTIVAGSVESGKSTMANTIVGTQLLASTSCLGVVMLEKHPESILPYQIKGHRIIPIQAANEELMEAGIASLRHDPDIIYMTEMRLDEWEFYLWSGEKGYKGITGTYHTVDPEDIPYQAALAVYSKKGGNLKGHLLSALKACELVFILESVGKGKKRIAKISEIYYDKEINTVFSNDLMRWDNSLKKWTYNGYLSSSLEEKIMYRSPETARMFIGRLRELAMKHPMISPMKESVRARMVLREGM